MRPLKAIVLHYSATPALMDVGAEEIRRWHLERGFADIGYHYVVRLDGTLERGRPLDVAGAHCKGHNAETVGVCYVGGGDGLDTRTPEQRETLDALISALRLLFGPLPVYGHREMKGAATLCPGFIPSQEYNSKEK